MQKVGLADIGGPKLNALQLVRCSLNSNLYLIVYYLYYSPLILTIVLYTGNPTITLICQTTLYSSISSYSLPSSLNLHPFSNNNIGMEFSSCRCVND